MRRNQVDLTYGNAYGYIPVPENGDVYGMPPRVDQEEWE
jgi:hypothetical protein